MIRKLGFLKRNPKKTCVFPNETILVSSIRQRPISFHPKMQLFPRFTAGAVCNTIILCWCVCICVIISICSEVVFEGVFPKVPLQSRGQSEAHTLSPRIRKLLAYPEYHTRRDDTLTVPAKVFQLVVKSAGTLQWNYVHNKRLN